MLYWKKNLITGKMDPNSELDAVAKFDELSVDETIAAQKTPVSIFQELCTAFNLGSPMYNLIQESGEAHLKTFQIGLTTFCLGITGKIYIMTFLQHWKQVIN